MAEFEDAFFLICCQYCGKEVPAVTLDDHEDGCEEYIQQVSREIQSGNREPVENQGIAGEKLEEICDICGEVYPVVCMEEHKAICEADLADYIQLVNAAAENKEDGKSASIENEPRIECVEIQRKSSPVNKENIQTSSTPGAKENTNKESSEVQETRKGAKTEIERGSKVQDTRRPKAEEDKNSKTQNKSKNVFTTCIEAESSMNFDHAKSNKKTQKYPPFECEDEDDSTDDLKYTSDDDCDETLEEFWTRAREILKRRKTFNVQ